MQPTVFHRPASLEEARRLFAAGVDPRYLAGGQTLLGAMKQRLAAPSDLIDLAAIAALKGMAPAADGLRLGAASRHADVAGAELVRARIPALAALAGAIGDRAVRNRGTLGGSLANNDPAADYPAAALALAATIHTDRRDIAADDFFAGLFSTVLAPGEIVVAATFRAPHAAAYLRIRNPASGYPMAGVFLARFADGAVRVAVTGAGAGGVFRLAAAERALQGAFAAAALDAIHMDAGEAIADLHGSAHYRAHLVGVLLRRAVTELTAKEAATG